MTREEIKTGINQILEDHFGVETAELKETDNFIDDLCSCGLDEIEVTYEIEKKFNIAIADDEISTKMTTIKDVYDLVETKLNFHLIN